VHILWFLCCVVAAVVSLQFWVSFCSVLVQVLCVVFGLLPLLPLCLFNLICNLLVHSYVFVDNY